MSLNQKLQHIVIPCYSFCHIGIVFLPFWYFRFTRLIPQPNCVSPSSCFCHTSNQFPSWSLSWPWIFFVCRVNQTIFGLMSSLILTLHVSVPVFTELVCIVFPTFLFLRHVCHQHPSSAWSFSSMFSVWSIHRIFCLLKMCDVSQRAHTPTRARIMCMLTFWSWNYFFLILAHPVYKMWIIQEPNTLELWNKLRFEEKITESIYHV